MQKRTSGNKDLSAGFASNPDLDAAFQVSLESPFDSIDFSAEVRFPTDSDGPNRTNRNKKGPIFQALFTILDCAGF
jgi:hypothetical protein